MDEATKRAVKKCLKDNGFDASVVDELIAARKTIRDDFAREAMGSLIKCSTYPFGGSVESIIKTAYTYADQAMLQRELLN
jgi:hypothetical protein